MSRPRTVSAAIRAQPDQFTHAELIETANEVLSKQTGAPSHVDSEAVARYTDQQLLDPPGTGIRPYGRRHLMQLVAIQTLRGMHFGAERIRTLVHGVDDAYLRLLCDDPVEAGKKAAVMSNWLNMLKNGRVGRANRGETSSLYTPDPQPVRHYAPAAKPPPTRPVHHGVAPALGGLDLPPAAVLPQQPPLDLPDAPSPRAPTTRKGRPPRTTLAASRSLDDALQAQLGPALTQVPPEPEPPPVVRPPRPQAHVTMAVAPSADDAPTVVRSNLPPIEAWARMTLADGVELHLRKRRTKLSDAELTALLADLRALLLG